MAECTQCRAPLSANARYCHYCGAAGAESAPSSGSYWMSQFLRGLLVCFVGLPLAAGAGCASCFGVFAATGGNENMFATGLVVAAVVTIAVLILFIRLVGGTKR